MKKSRSIILQVAVWLGIWSIFAFADSLQDKPSIIYLITALRILVLAILFNVVSYALLPLYFAGKRQAFLWWTLVTFVGYLSLNIGQEIGVIRPLHQAAIPADKASARSRSPLHWGFMLIPTSLIGIAVFGVASVAKTFAALEAQRKAEEDANRRRLEAEIALLKSQINPHFLLNTLNNLYSLSLVDPDHTPEALLKLAEMVRYILYECQKPRVALSHDLAFIQSYLALQQLRLPPNVVLAVTWPEALPTDAQVEPMILITFIENAFKHGLTTKRDCAIHISLSVAAGQLRLQVRNPIAEKSSGTPAEPAGIGTANARKRLEHAYPGQHALRAGPVAQTYHVDLTLSLEKQKS
jgi:signal transduction histidine kinase